MMWHVIYEDCNGQVQSRAARSRDSAIHMARDFWSNRRWFAGRWDPTGRRSNERSWKPIMAKAGPPDSNPARFPDFPRERIPRFRLAGVRIVLCGATSMYSMIAIAKPNGVDPDVWLADVLRIGDHPASRLHELPPRHWPSRHEARSLAA